MALKYKLVKETTSQKLTPEDLRTAAKIIGPYVMKDIMKGELNYQDYEELEKELGNAGIDQDKVNQILDMWAERSRFIGVNENEKKVDPIHTSMQKLLAYFRQAYEESGDVPKLDPNAKNTFKTKVNEIVKKVLKQKLAQK